MELDEAAINTLSYWFGLAYWRPRVFAAKGFSYFDELWQERWFAKEEQTARVDEYLR